MNKKLVLLCLFLSCFAVAFLMLNCCGKGNMIINGGDYFETMEATRSRKLKANALHSGMDENDSDDDPINIEDYRPIDPVPSSKAVRPGPIQHGTPLMPYIPKPSPPPTHPKLVGAP